MKTAYSEGWEAGYYGQPQTANPYQVGWARDDLRMFGHPIAGNWDDGWQAGHEAADCERAAEDDSRKRDAREGFDG